MRPPPLCPNCHEPLRSITEKGDATIEQEYGGRKYKTTSKDISRMKIQCGNCGAEIIDEEIVNFFLANSQ